MTKEKELKEVILLKAEKESIEIKEKIKEELSERKRADDERFREEIKQYEESKKKEIDERVEGEYHKRIYEIKKSINLEKKRYVEHVLEEIIKSIPMMNNEDKKKIYEEIKRVIGNCLFKKPTIVYPKNDEHIVKNIFKGYDLKPSDDLEFGIVAVKDEEIVDLSLHGIKDMLKEKIKAMLI